MDMLKAERIAHLPDYSDLKCRFCEKKLELIRIVIDSETGDVIHMFKCECGDRSWTD
jgi:hypothetical protein